MLAMKPKGLVLNCIHIEEDAGKLIHSSIAGSLIDYNRVEYL